MIKVSLEKRICLGLVTKANLQTEVVFRIIERHLDEIQALLQIKYYILEKVQIHKREQIL
jgi:hypothetical protein